MERIKQSWKINSIQGWQNYFPLPSLSSYTLLVGVIKTRWKFSFSFESVYCILRVERVWYSCLDRWLRRFSALLFSPNWRGVHVESRETNNYSLWFIILTTYLEIDDHEVKEVDDCLIQSPYVHEEGKVKKLWQIEVKFQFNVQMWLGNSISLKTPRFSNTSNSVRNRETCLLTHIFFFFFVVKNRKLSNDKWKR